MENITLEQLNSILSNYVSTSLLESRIQNFTTVNEVLSNIKIGSVDAELLSSNLDAYANVSTTDDGHLNFKFGMPRGYNGLNGEGAVIDYEHLKIWITNLGIFATIDDLNGLKHNFEITADTFNSYIEDNNGRYAQILQRLQKIELKVGDSSSGNEGGIYVTMDLVIAYVSSQGFLTSITIDEDSIASRVFDRVSGSFSEITQTVDEIRSELSSYSGNNLLINSQFANDIYGWSIIND